MEQTNQLKSQFHLFTQRRFLPFFVTQFLGALNDGTQSAFFGPAKYSLIPQHLNSDELLAGNAQISMGTFGSILLGTLIGGWMVTLENGITLLSGAIVLVSIIGWLCSREIPEAPSENPKQKLS